MNTTLGLITLAFFFISLNTSAQTLRIGILDTGFCLQQLKTTQENIIVHPPQDLTNSVRIKCDKQTKLGKKRFHGQRVLNLFLEKLRMLKKGEKLEIFPMLIFNASGTQKVNYWKAALEIGIVKKLDLFLAAAGLPFTKNKLQLPKIQIPMFLSSGRIGGPIRTETKLWPQSLAPHKDIFLIGSYYPPLSSKDIEVLDDQGLLYKDQIDYYMSSGTNLDHIKGSSRAVALALSRALNLCFSKFKRGLRQCLANNKVLKKVEDSKRTLPSL